MKKYYTYAMVLYKETESYDYNEVIKYIENNYENYAYIVHDRDDKKIHTHVLVHFKNKRYATAISKELGVPINYIEKANLIPYLRYLIHFDDEDKFQYNVDDVRGPMKKQLISILDPKLDEVEQVSIISSFIFENSDYLSHTSLLQYVLRVKCYSAYRRNFALFNQLILEHNRNL